MQLLPGLRRIGDASDLERLLKESPLHELENPPDTTKISQVPLFCPTSDFIQAAHRGWLQAWFRWIIAWINDLDFDFDGVLAALHPAFAYLASASGFSGPSSPRRSVFVFIQGLLHGLNLGSKQ
jgi:hypothetical protein